jgi:hypothetical protein
VSRCGWLDLSQFRWHNLVGWRAVQAGLGVLTQLMIGIATGRAWYSPAAALGALPAGAVSFQG